MHDQLRVTIQKTFNVAPELAAKLHEELIQCVKRKHLVSDGYTQSFGKGFSLGCMNFPKIQGESHNLGRSFLQGSVNCCHGFVLDRLKSGNRVTLLRP